MENGSTFAVLAADVAPVHGLSPSFVCYDELAQVPSRALYDALGTALGGRATLSWWSSPHKQRAIRRRCPN